MDNRDLDALIAVKVMGWRTHSHSERMWYTGYTSIPKDNFKPSSEISAAWEALEKFDSYTLTRTIDGGAYCEILWLNYGSFDIIGTGEAEAAPMAICLAALKAKGLKVDE
jgi:hypothetical protein